MRLCIQAPGAQTTVQDAGRFGYAAQGYRSCGACDAYAHKLANLLIGNDPGAAVLEATLQGFTLKFEGTSVFALTGADMGATLDGKQIPRFAPLLATAGSVLRLGTAKTGLRSYLAVAGGITTPPVLGSRSTDLACHLGGLEGRALRAGDVVPTGASAEDAIHLWRRIQYSYAARPLREDAACLPARPWRFEAAQKLPLFRVVAGPQQTAFTPQGMADFSHGIYTLTPDCNRMACKLDGPAVGLCDSADILSDGIVAGSIQISANGQPIVMLADHQTTGGYAKIGTVISADLPGMAQLRPGDKAAFCFVSVEQAVAAARAEAARLQKVKERIV